MELISTIIVSLVTGVVAGVYSGLVVSRVSRFEELRNEVKRIILAIDYIGGSGQQIEIKAKKDPAEIASIGSDFLALGHKNAGDKTFKLFSEISNSVNMPDKTTIEKMNEIYPLWQKECRELSPSMKVILNLKPWI